MEQLNRYIEEAKAELQIQLDAGEAVADLFAQYHNELIALGDAPCDRAWVVQAILHQCGQHMAKPFLRASGWRQANDGRYVRGVS